MRCITITDSTQDGRFLAFDLIDILRPLEASVVDSEWELSGVECTGAAADTLHKLSNHARISGKRLFELAANVHQIFEGEFTAYSNNQLEPWLIIRAVDGAAYDVESDDKYVLAVMKEHFLDVEEIETAAPSSYLFATAKEVSLVV
ncbi:MAG: hypothetical protein ACPGWR_06330 [Ardenticatenaceae bacterium]